jgi:GT2 family glycosyltransferase
LLATGQRAQLEAMRAVRIIAKSGLVDKSFYCARLGRRDVDPVRHYVSTGAAAGLNPNPLFATNWYRARHEDLGASGENPLLHYLKHGRKPGYDPSPNFDTAWFVERERDNGLNPLVAYLNPGGVTQPVESFAPALQQSADVQAAADYRRRKSAHSRIVVFTALTRVEHQLRLPGSLDPTIDYLCFSHRPTPDLGVFEIRPITMHDAAKAAAFVKTHPHLLLADYDIAIWIAPDLQVRCDLADLAARVENAGAAFGSLKHLERDCAYDEAYVASRQRWDNLFIIAAQVARYRAVGMPAHAGLLATDCMIWNLRHPKVGEFLNGWWREIKDGTGCDQIPLAYALWRDPQRWISLFEDRAALAGQIARWPAGLVSEAPDGPLVDPYDGPSYAAVKAARLAAHKDRRIDVIVCVHNALDDVRLCLASVAATLLTHHRVIIVDDGSEPETAAFLASFAAARPGTLLRRHEMAEGYTRAANAGLRMSDADVIVLLNSDTIVAGDWVLKLADALYSMPGIGIVGPLSNAGAMQSVPSNQNRNGLTAINPLAPGEDVASMDRRCEAWTRGAALPLGDIINGFCYAIRRAVIERIGLFDEVTFPKGYGEEDDFSLRAADAGFLLAVATHTFVFHAKNKSYGAAARSPLSRAGARNLARRHPGRMAMGIRNMRSHPMLRLFRDRTRELFEKP